MTAAVNKYKTNSCEHPHITHTDVGHSTVDALAAAIVKITEAQMLFIELFPALTT